MPIGNYGKRTDHQHSGRYQLGFLQRPGGSPISAVTANVRTPPSARLGLVPLRRSRSIPMRGPLPSAAANPRRVVSEMLISPIMPRLGYFRPLRPTPRLVPLRR